MAGEVDVAAGLDFVALVAAASVVAGVAFIARGLAADLGLVAVAVALAAVALTRVALAAVALAAVVFALSRLRGGLAG